METRGKTSPLFTMNFPRGSVVKEITSNAEDKRDAGWSWVENIPWSRKWQPSPVLLPVIIYEHRSMAGYSPWVAKSWIYEHSCMHMSFYIQHLLRKLIVSFCSVHWKCVYISRIWKSSLWNVVIKETVLLSPSFSRKVRAKICWHLAPRCQRRQWHPTPVLLPGKSRGRRSLMGCSPWGR